MPYFPRPEETKYYCPNCKQWFIPGNASCCVLHPPGTCCHLYDTPTTPPERLDKIDKEIR